MQKTATISQQIQAKVLDVIDILKQYDLRYRVVDQYYLQVGELSGIQGWILHISVIRPHLIKLVEKLIPELIALGIPFKIIHNTDTAFELLNGQLGYSGLGKIFKIYPTDSQHAIKVAKHMIALTHDFRGPQIPTDIHLGGTVYTRYGGFNSIRKTSPTGEIENYIYDHKEQLVKDDSPVPFRLPKGIAWPFSCITNITPTKINNYLSVIGDSYVVTKIIKGDAKGNVFHTLRMKGLWFQWCIVKEGLHDMAVDESGRDIQDRLTWQYQVQKALEKDIPVPKPYALFKQNGNTYFAMEYVKGPSLYEVIITTYAGSNWTDLPPNSKNKLIDYLESILRYLEILQEKKYIHRDITPDNFILDNRGRLVMIDMELTYDLGNNHPHPPFALGTTGFMSPEQTSINTPTFKEDI